MDYFMEIRTEELPIKCTLCLVANFLFYFFINDFYFDIIDLVVIYGFFMILS